MQGYQARRSAARLPGHRARDWTWQGAVMVGSWRSPLSRHYITMHDASNINGLSPLVVNTPLSPRSPPANLAAAHDHPGGGGWGGDGCIKRHCHRWLTPHFPWPKTPMAYPAKPLGALPVSFPQNYGKPDIGG